MNFLKLAQRVILLNIEVAVEKAKGKLSTELSYELN